MDSLTQIALGAAVMAAVAPPGRRRAALVAGGLLGTLPDLDVVPLALVDDPVLRMTWHRSFSHSLVVLLPAGVLLWTGLRRWSHVVREAPGQWLAAILLNLATHVLLDAHTVYGTQLWWPLPAAPTMWSTLFIIDPLYTVPLVAGCIAAWRLCARAAAQRWLLVGLALAQLYLGWSWVARHAVERQLQDALAARALPDAPSFVVPAPFTTLVWRAVALTPTGYLEGRTTPWRPSISLTEHADAHEARRWAVAEIPAARRMHWFASGFIRATLSDGRLVLSDLRMGAEPDYFFRFVVARGTLGPLTPIVPETLPRPAVTAARLRAVWQVP